MINSLKELLPKTEIPMIKRILKKLIIKFIKSTLWITPIKRRYLDIIKRKYIEINSEASKGRTIQTPWVCDPAFDVHRHAEYITEVFNDYFINSGLSSDQIIGKTILEIGPGTSLGVALKFIAAGAERVVCIDRFHSLLGSFEQSEIYEKLISTLSEQERNRLKDTLIIGPTGLFINKNKIQYLNVSAEKLDSVLPGIQFDFIISRAVLEHVFDIETTMETMHLLLKPGGFMLHEVDFRDHGVFTDFGLHPLTFLTIDKETWYNMASDIGAPNRMTFNYYRHFFDLKKYKCNFVIVRLIDNDTRKLRLNSINDINFDSFSISKYKRHLLDRKYPTGDEDLSVAAAFYCAIKEN